MKTYYSIALCTVFVFGGAAITGSANVIGRAKENSPSIDLWLVKGRQIEDDIINRQVLLRRKFNVVTTKQTAERMDKNLAGVKSVENDFPVITPSTRELAEEIRAFLDFEEV